MTEKELNDMMADVGEVLMSHHARVTDILELGGRCFISAFGQLKNEGCTDEELTAYATFQTRQLNKAIQARIADGKQELN